MASSALVALISAGAVNVAHGRRDDRDGREDRRGQHD